LVAQEYGLYEQSVLPKRAENLDATPHMSQRREDTLFSSLLFSTLLCSVLLLPSLQSAEPKHTAPTKRTCHRCRCCGDEGDLILQYSKQPSVTIRVKLCGTVGGNAGSRVCEGCSDGHTHPLSHTHTYIQHICKWTYCLFIHTLCSRQSISPIRDRKNKYKLRKMIPTKCKSN
jgi:hypothetical protein